MEERYIKKCPACGGFAAVGYYGIRPFVGCCDCGKSTHACNSSIEAIDMWNEMAERKTRVTREGKRV